MRLLTHNLLVCNVKGCSANNFPMKIKATAVERQETEFNPDFVRHMLPKLDWKALCLAAKDLDVAIPSEVPPNAAEDESFLKSLHDILVDLHIKEGALACPNCNRAYPITNGVPNMLLNEDEV